MSKIRAVIAKEWAEVFKNRIVLFSVVILPIILSAMPLIMLRAMSGLSGTAGGGDVTDLPAQFMATCSGLNGEECLLLYVVNQFLTLYLLMPLAIPTAIAAYSIVGEKTTRCLEPLLATPIQTGELFLAKALAAVIPAILGGWLSFGVFALGTLLMIHSPALIARILDPMWLFAVGVIMPLLAVASVSLTVIVSSRVSDPRTAEQVSMVIIVPLLLLFLGQVSGLIILNFRTMLFTAGLVLLADVGLVYVGVQWFQREVILTRWK